MKLEETTVRAMLRRRGLKNKGMIEICQDDRTGEFVMVAAKGIRRKWLLFNLPEAMWRGSGSREEVMEASRQLLEDKILTCGGAELPLANTPANRQRCKD